MRFHQVRLPRRMSTLKIMSHHPFAVPFFTITFLVLMSGIIYLLAWQTHRLPSAQGANIVIISYDHKKQTVPSRNQTVGSLLNKLHIELGEGDVVEPAANTPIDQDQFRINIYRAVPVLVIDSNNKTFAFSAATTPRSIAQQSGQTVYPEDRMITRPVKNFLKTGAIGEELVIKRAIPVNVDLYGALVVLRTHAKTVGELVKEKNIKLEKTDQLVPAATTPITAGQQISFLRTGTKTITVTEKIAMPVQNIVDPSLAYGTGAIRQQGNDGQQIVTYEVKLENNVEKGRTVIQKVVTKEAVTQIMVVGSSLSGIKGDMALAGISPSDYEYVDFIVSHESGWCPTKAQGMYGACPATPPDPIPTYGGYGLCQSTPPQKMATAGADWTTNPVTQLKWCHNYAMRRYGTWSAAYAYWVSHRNW
jgi:resuscitation-promoting factor RpfB